MTRLIIPSPQFTVLSEAEIMAALNDPLPGNPVASEVGRLIEGYRENVRAFLEPRCNIPESIQHVTPQSSIEAVAMRLATETIEQELSK